MILCTASRINIGGIPEELHGPAVGGLAEVKQRWSVIGWVKKCIISSSSVLRKAR
jgi:hypothetical protein